MKILFILLLITTFGYAQKENIDLPESNVKQDSLRNSSHYSIYITLPCFL
jgi:biopolymer transport protein ExbD